MQILPDEGVPAIPQGSRGRRVTSLGRALSYSGSQASTGQPWEAGAPGWGPAGAEPRGQHSSWASFLLQDTPPPPPAAPLLLLCSRRLSKSRPKMAMVTGVYNAPLLWFAWLLEFCGWAIMLAGVAAIQQASVAFLHCQRGLSTSITVLAPGPRCAVGVGADAGSWAGRPHMRRQGARALPSTLACRGAAARLARAAASGERLAASMNEPALSPPPPRRAAPAATLMSTPRLWAPAAARLQASTYSSLTCAITCAATPHRPPQHIAAQRVHEELLHSSSSGTAVQCNSSRSRQPLACPPWLACLACPPAQ